MVRFASFVRAGSLAASLLLLSSAAWADVLFYDGFVVGEGGYTTASVNGYAGDALSGKSSAASTGFSGNWLGASATVRMQAAGLAMPATSSLRSGGGAMWMNYSNNGYRALSHQLANMPTTGTVYFMTLMKCQAQAMDGYGEGDMALLGVKQEGSFVSTVSKQGLHDAYGLWFGFMKSGGKIYPAVKVNNSVTPFSSAVAQMDTTYICEGKIEYGAGAGGVDRVSWNIRTVAEWDAAETKEAWAGTSELAFGKLTYLSASYLIATGGRSIWFDEVRAATTYGECVGKPDLAVATGLPDGYRAASGTFSTMARAGETVTAPEFVNPDVTERTLRCSGYVIEKKVDGNWQVIQSVATRTHAFTVPEEWRNTADQLRLTWQWDESPRLVSCDGNPVLISDLFKAAGYIVEGNGGIPDSSKLHSYTQARNAYAAAGERLFDGLTWYVGTGEVRMLGYMVKEGGSYVALDVPADVLAGDELLLCEYRLSPVSYWGNQRSRMPTAWTLSVSNVVADATDWAVVDEKSGVDVSRVPSDQNISQSQEASARFDYPLETPVPFTSLKFQPTDSAVYQSNLANKAQAIDWGLLEIALLVRRANPKGTLRVSVPGIKADGFSNGDRALLTEAATLTAPEAALKLDGVTSCPLTGWVLETFDEATGLWTETATGTGTSYDWTPNPDVRARLTWLYDHDTPMYKVTAVSERTSDESIVGKYIKENVVVEPAAVGGFYAAGAQVTVTATPDTTDFSAGEATDSRSYQSQFVRWIGDTDGLDVDLTSPSITFTVDRPRVLHAVFNRNWLLCPNNNPPIIHNANWRFEVEYDMGARTVKIKKWTRGYGRLNLDTPVYAQSSGNPYRITVIDSEVAAVSGGSCKTKITELILPKTLVTLGAQGFRMNSITNLVMDCPDLVSIGAAVLARNYSLEKAVVNIPSVKSITADFPFFNWSCTDTDLSTWNLSSLTNIPYQILYQQVGVAQAQAHACQSGTLTLPRVQSIAGEAFENFAQAAEFHLGTADAKLGSISGNAFKSCAATNFVLGCTRAIQVGENAFAKHLSGGPEVFRFIAAAPADKATMERFLASNSSSHMAKVYVSRIRSAEWSTYVTPVDDIDDAAVKAQAEALGAVGAFKTDAGEWKAFVFAEKMPFDPKGTYLMVR